MENVERTKIVIDKTIELYKNQSDYQNRKELCGFGITIANYCQRFYNAGTPEYTEIYQYLYNALSEIYQKSIQNVNSYIVNRTVKIGNKTIFDEFTTQERTEQEAIQWAINKPVYDNFGKLLKKYSVTDIKITKQ